MEFKISSEYKPAGDQIEAIEQIVSSYESGANRQVLLGVTGSGKTFTMANVIERLQVPTLIIAHNKTLAAQLYGEFLKFFPDNAVEYFVSYYDYYQPEAYIPSSDTYIEKDSAINEEIEKLRNRATRSLIERRDVIIVASVSCIYGLGSPETYSTMIQHFESGKDYNFDDVLMKLVQVRYERNDVDFHRGVYRVKGDTIEIFPSHEDETAYRLEFFGDTLDRISEFNAITGKTINELTELSVYPNTHYVTSAITMDTVIEQMKKDLLERCSEFVSQNKLLEEQRLTQRTMFDIEMLKETGYCTGIENYSRYFDGRLPGSTPYTLISYLPKDALVIIDESHITIPQIRGMYNGDRSRKMTLVDFGFRLPVALDNRPLKFDEFDSRLYNNGVKYTALISSDETLGSFIETLQSFGLQAGLIQNGNSSKLVLIGSGDSYISKSLNPTSASNVVEKLFTSSSPTTTYDYSASELLYATITTKQTATEDTLLSTFDTPWGGSTLKSVGNLALTVNGENKIIKIDENETFGSLVDKLKEAGVQAAFLNGQLYISDAGGVSINTAATTSAIINPNAGIKLAFKDTIDGFLASSSSVTQTTTLIEEHTVSASNYADMNTKLGTLNISSGTLSVYRNGQKALINDVDENWSFSDLQTAISHKFSDVKLNIEDGYLKFYSDTAGVSVEVGSTTDSSNFLAITGMHKDEDGSSISSRELYKVNTDSKITEAGLFRRGTVKKGDFTIGTAKFTIDENTTLGDIISQINNSDEANATAWWDSIGGKLVIKSRTTGAALINIEAGKSDFTDIMGYTTSEWKADGSVKFTQLNADTQELGKNAKFTINGTAYTAASNTVASDISKIKGVTLDLKSISGDTVTLKIEKDKETVSKSLEEVVNAYNELMQNVDEAIASQGKLHDQTTLKMIRNQLKMYMTSSDSGADVFRNLNSIGISVSSASAGNISTSNQNIINLAFDKDKFLEAFEKDDKAVKALLLGGENNKGVFTKVEELVDNALKGVTGYFDSAEASYDKKVGNLQMKINKQTASLQKYRALLEKKFSAMDMMIANMQQQYGSYLGTSGSLMR